MDLATGSSYRPSPRQRTVIPGLADRENPSNEKLSNHRKFDRCASFDPIPETQFESGKSRSKHQQRATRDNRLLLY